MTRSVTDLDRVKDVFIDPNRAARLGVPELSDFRTLKPSEFRILFLTCWPNRKGEAAAEIRTAVRLAVEALQRAGARAEEHEPTFLEQTVDIANSFAIRDITSAKVREMTDTLGGREDAALQRFIELIERVEGSIRPNGERN